MNPRLSHHFSLVRGLGPADVLTLLNATAGTLSVFASLAYARDHAAWQLLVALVLLPMALLFDGLDGWVARRARKHSAMGRELDSLSDIISFGVAPAVLAASLGLHGALDLPFLVLLVLAGVARLARFNITAEGLSAPTGKVRYFEGTPVTFSLLPLVALAAVTAVGTLPFGVVHVGPLEWHPVSMVFLASAAAMVSRTLRVPKP